MCGVSKGYLLVSPSNNLWKQVWNLSLKLIQQTLVHMCDLIEASQSQKVFLGRKFWDPWLECLLWTECHVQLLFQIWLIVDRSGEHMDKYLIWTCNSKSQNRRILCCRSRGFQAMSWERYHVGLCWMRLTPLWQSFLMRTSQETWKVPGVLGMINRGDADLSPWWERWGWGSWTYVLDTFHTPLN